MLDLSLRVAAGCVWTERRAPLGNPGERGCAASPCRSLQQPRSGRSRACRR